MSLDWLATPISEDAPCGPDLGDADDAAFVDYYYEAESRMPERYFVPGIKSDGMDYTPGTLFDQKSIKAAKEKETILGLLKRSRDVRLLSLLARFMVLAGRLDDFAEALDGIAILMEAFPEAVIPLDQSDRRSAIDELGNTGVVGIPMQYINLAGAAEVTYRKYLAASGQSDPREGEVGLSTQSLTSAVGSPSNRTAVEKAHAALSNAAAALTRIKSACLRSDRPFTPATGPTLEAIREIQSFINMGRSDLVPWSEDANASFAADADDSTTDLDSGSAEAMTETSSSGPATTTVTVVATKLPNRAAAKQALGLIEAWMARNEPASPALLLITQARLLIGKPLIEAIEALLPEHAGRTRIDFGNDTGFVLPLDRLRMLTAEAAKEGAAAPAAAEDPGPPPEISSRADVAGHLRSVDDFFRAREPASPIPLLLFRARNYLDKDFAAIVAELVPGKPPG